VLTLSGTHARSNTDMECAFGSRDLVLVGWGAAGSPRQASVRRGWGCPVLDAASSSQICKGPSTRRPLLHQRGCWCLRKNAFEEGQKAAWQQGVRGKKCERWPWEPGRWWGRRCLRPGAETPLQPVERPRRSRYFPAPTEETFFACDSHW